MPNENMRGLRLLLFVIAFMLTACVTIRYERLPINAYTLDGLRFGTYQIRYCLSDIRLPHDTCEYIIGLYDDGGAHIDNLKIRIVYNRYGYMVVGVRQERGFWFRNVDTNACFEEADNVMAEKNMLDAHKCW